MEFFVILLIVVLLVVIGIAAYYDDQQWERYAAMHHCSVHGHTEPTTGIGIGSKGGTTVVFNPGQTIYECDGGEIIIK